MSFLFTDPDHPHRSPQSHLLNREKAGNGYVDYKEDVCEQLQEFGVPLRPAELAVIDMRSDVIGAWKAKKTAFECACELLEEVKRIYKVEL